MSKHYELRHEQDYIAKLREDGDTCTEIVFFKGEQIYRAEFPTSNLGTAVRSGYLLCMVVSVAREHKAAAAAASARIVSDSRPASKLTNVESAAVKLGNL